MDGDDLSLATTAEAEQHGQRKAEELMSGQEVPGVGVLEALSNKPTSNVNLSADQESRNGLEGNAVPNDQQFGRHDTLDSLRSSFGHRTSTGWSTIVSTTTDSTEPDLATLHDDLEDQHASSPRPFASTCRSNTFQSSPPTRASSFAPVNRDNIRAAPGAIPPDAIPAIIRSGIRGAQEVSSPLRGASFSRQTDSGLSNLGAVPTAPMSLPSGSLVNSARAAPRPAWEQIDDGFADRGSSPPHSPMTIATRDDVAQLCSVVEPAMEGVELPSSAEDSIPDALSASLSASHLRDSEHMWISDASSLQRPDDKLIQDVCDKLLKHVFGVELQDLATTEAASAAYGAVSYCLDELSQIVPNGGLVSLSPSIYEVPRDHSESGFSPVGGTGNGSDFGGHSGGNDNGSGRAQKRPPNGDDDEQNREGPEDGNGPGGNGKRPRIDPPLPNMDQNLSCPFRKRNPAKFNVRDHQSCAVQSFPDISQLKRHVKIFHKQKEVSGFACPRCKRNMGAKETLRDHLTVPNDKICDSQVIPLSQNPEDGITAKIEDALNGRRANTKVDTWEILWRTLFPDDELADIPDPEFVPPIELDEVHAEFHTINCHEELKGQLSQEELWMSGPGQNTEDLVARIVEICENHIEVVFETCRRTKTGSAPNQKRRKRVQKPKAPQGSVDQAQSHLTPQLAMNVNPAGYAGGSNGSSPSPLDTPRSGESWAAYVGHSLGQSGVLEHLTPAAAVQLPTSAYHDMLNVDSMSGGGGGLPGTEVQRAMAQQPVHGRGGHRIQSQPHHHRGPSADSAVSFERAQGFLAGSYYGQAPATERRRPFQDLRFAGQAMQLPTPEGSFRVPVSMQMLADSGMGSMPIGQPPFGFPPSIGHDSFEDFAQGQQQEMGGTTGGDGHAG